MAYLESRVAALCELIVLSPWCKPDEKSVQRSARKMTVTVCGAIRTVKPYQDHKRIARNGLL